MSRRDFTDPRWTVADRATLRYIVDSLADRAARPARRTGWTSWTDPHAAHRWLVPSWDRLAAADAAAGVGFFGKLRPGGADSFAAVHALARDAAHAEAVTRAAATYESIRIHRLTLAGPPPSRPPLEILETLYVDYGSSPPRREVRVA